MNRELFTLYPYKKGRMLLLYMINYYIINEHSN